MNKTYEKKIFAFDMDGTLSNSRLDKLSDEVKTTLRELNDLGKKIVILSSGSLERIYNQIEDINVHVIGSYGYKEGDILDGRLVNVEINKTKNNIDKKLISDKVDKFRNLTHNTDYVGNSYIINEAGMIVVSLPGDALDKESRDNYDPDGLKRKMYLDILQSEFPDKNVYICGKTSYDIVDKSMNKYNALLNYCNKNGYSIEEVLFFGDEFDKKEGNDYCLKENGVEGINVSSPKEICKLVYNEIRKQQLNDTHNSDLEVYSREIG